MASAHAIRHEAERFVREHGNLAEVVAQVVLERRALREGRLAAGPTPMQRKTLDFLISYIDEHGFAPSYTEIIRVIHVGRSEVSRLLHGLQDRGFVSFIPHKHRSVTVLPAARAANDLTRKFLRNRRTRMCNDCEQPLTSANSK